MDEETCDLNVKVIYYLGIKVQFCKYSDFQVEGVGCITSHMIGNISDMSTFTFSPAT